MNQILKSVAKFLKWYAKLGAGAVSYHSSYEAVVPSKLIDDNRSI